jgi:hypothetical protein
MSNPLDILICSWKARLEFLTQQLEALKSGKYGHEKVSVAGLGQANENLIPADILRLESAISELKSLLAKLCVPAAVTAGWDR